MYNYPKQRCTIHPSGFMIKKTGFVIQKTESLASNHRLSPLWVRVPQVAMLRTCPNMTLAVERDVKPQL